MNVKISVCYLLSFTLLMLAPPEDMSIFDSSTHETSIKNPDIYRRWESIYTPNPRFDGRSEFEQALKEKNLDRAKELFNQIRTSPVTTEMVVAHLHDRYNNLHGKITDLYSGKSMDQARQKFTQDLNTVSPHLGKIFRDSFTTKKTVPTIAREDQPYYDWLNTNPERITNPEEFHEYTPFEVAVKTGSKEMAQKTVEVAKKNKVSALDLTDPLINEYKKIMKKEGSQAAYDFLQKIYALDIPRISDLLHTYIKDIDFQNSKPEKIKNNDTSSQTKNQTFPNLNRSAESKTKQTKI